jgi:hypothetical protein
MGTNASKQVSLYNDTKTGWNKNILNLIQNKTRNSDHCDNPIDYVTTKKYNVEAKKTKESCDLHYTSKGIANLNYRDAVVSTDNNAVNKGSDYLSDDDILCKDLGYMTSKQYKNKLNVLKESCDEYYVSRGKPFANFANNTSYVPLIEPPKQQEYTGEVQCWDRSWQRGYANCPPYPVSLVPQFGDDIEVDNVLVTMQDQQAYTGEVQCWDRSWQRGYANCPPFQ